MRRKRRAVLLAAAALLIAALVATFGWVGPPHMTAEVFAWYPDGRVARVSPPGAFYQACVHPDGTHVLFAGAKTGPPRIWEADLATGDVRALTPPGSAAFLASYSWDGSRIVFSSDRDFAARSIGVEEIPDPRLYRPATAFENYRHFSLYVMNADGGDVRRVTRGKSRDLRGTFSPDGTRLAFYSSRPPYAPIWTTAADGSEEPARVQFYGDRKWNVFRPWYTADGSTLYFFGSTFEGPDRDRKRILHVPAEGGVPETLPWDDRGKSQAPFIDPEGQNLLIHTTRTGRSELWELPLDGGEPRVLRPPEGSVPPDCLIMHPTRARNGVITFDASYHHGSLLEQRVHSLRERVREAVRWRVSSMREQWAAR